MRKNEKPDTEKLKRTLTRMPEDYQPEIENFSYKNLFIRTMVVWIGNIIGFLIIAPFKLGLTVDSITTAIIVVTIVGIANAILWPIITRVFMPFFIYTFGAASLIFNGLFFWILNFFVPGFTIDGPAIFLTPLCMAGVNTLISGIVTIDDNSSYYRAVTRDAIKLRRKNPVKKSKGMIILEIDGLSCEILKEAIDKNYMPTLKSWIEIGSHHITEWETDLSSQTGASQAGILHGNNKDIVAYRWVEKENNNKIMTCGSFSDINCLEKRISNGDGLLSKNGGSRCNLFSGDTDNVIFTLSKALNLQKMYNKAWVSVFANPNSFARICILFIEELVLEIYSQIKHYIKNIRPRIRRGPIYTLTRAGTNVFLREVNTQSIILDIMVGKLDTIYATYLGYDEIAHHSGTRDEDSFKALKKIDKQFSRINDSIKYSERKYDIVIQSDHGQCNGATFKQRYGVSFEKFVRSLLPEDMTIYSIMGSNDKNDLKDVFIPLNKQKTYLENMYNDSLEYIEKYSPVHYKFKKPENSEVIILGSGNLALIYLTQWPRRLYYEEIVEFFPNLIPGLIKNKYIGFILVNSTIKGPMVIGEGGIYYLNSGEVKGENPLKVYGKHAEYHLKRTNSFKHCPDILVNSFYNPETEEVCAFEELVGSHGGMGGPQTKPFIMHPSTWQIENDIIGAENLYKLLKREIKNLEKYEY
nr:phage holin family protein [Methanobrevibacter sp. 87.7]